LTIILITVSSAITGSTKIALSSAKSFDGQDAGPKWASAAGWTSRVNSRYRGYRVYALSPTVMLRSHSSRSVEW